MLFAMLCLVFKGYKQMVHMLLHLSVCLWLYSPCGPWPHFQFLNPYTMSLPAHSEPWPLLQFLNHFTQTVGFRGWGISPSQGRFLHTGQHTQNKRTQTSMPLSGIRTHDPRFRADEDDMLLDHWTLMD
jgi:hypothetical protein